VGYWGRDVLTNPPPSSGGILMSYSLDLLDCETDPGASGAGPVRRLVEVMERTNRARTDEFHEALQTEGFLERFLAREAIVATEGMADQLGARGGPAGGGRLGSTTHVAVLDADGACASVTCSNGSGSGVIVPGTGIHLNNMLGEQDLNPLGFHRQPAGLRIPSMMAPTVVLHDGEPEVALGSAGSNRIRSAVLQTLLGVVDDGLGAEEAVARPRLHFEEGRVDAEPGVDPQTLLALEAEGYAVRRWAERNLYFGGVQAVARDPQSGELSGGGDPRRGGSALLAG
jgi:gamma-glutamyltranspeptidase/glutathione hydrolase